MSGPDHPFLAVFLLDLIVQVGAPPASEVQTTLQDTIYGLAVDPSEYPEQPFVYLLDEGVVEYEADGRGRESYRQVAQILTQEGAETLGELSFYYHEGREKVTVDWIRVLSSAGEPLSEGAIHEQESALPVAERYPVYTDLRLRRISIGGLAPGRLLDIRFTEETLDPYLAGDFMVRWPITTGVPTLRSHLKVDVPSELRPRIRPWNVKADPVTIDRAGRRIYEWSLVDVPVPEPEYFTRWRRDGSMGVTVGGAVGWDSIARWYVELARDRYELTPAIIARLDSIMDGTRTLTDTLERTYYWVSRGVRYASISLGLGGYQPRHPAEVIETLVGDCKDKSTLFIALLRHMGLEAHPVLVNQQVEIDRSLPSINQFDHMIVAVKRGFTHDSNGKQVPAYHYVDLTAASLPYAALPAALQGQHGFLIHPEGRGQMVELPASPLRQNTLEWALVGSLTRQGDFEGRFSARFNGTPAYELYPVLQVGAAGQEGRDAFAHAAAAELFQEVVADSPRFDLRPGRIEIEFQLRATRASSPAGDMHILTLPLDPMLPPSLVRELEAQLPRRNPIDAEQVLGPVVVSESFDVLLPEGWVADLPSPVSASSSFGIYRSEYTQEWRMLQITRYAEGRRGLFRASRMDQLLAWLRAVTADRPQYITLKVGQPEGDNH